MRTIHPIPITKESFAPFGKYYNLLEYQQIVSEDFRCNITPEPIISEPMNFGFTFCQPGSFKSISMERHFLTEEPQFCGDGPMILTVANSDPETCPKEEDVVAFLMKPGDVAVLDKCIWHDANHAVEKPCLYYFIAKNSTDPRETVFVEVQPEPVYVEIQ